MAPDEVKLAIKDTLRAARFVVRGGRRVAPPAAAPLVDLVDDVFARAEHVARSITGRTGREQSSARDLRAALERPSRGSDLRAAIYRTACAILAERGLRNVFVSEAVIADVVDAVPSPCASAASLGAKIAIGLAAARPVRWIDMVADEDDLVGGLNEDVALAVGLAVAVIAVQTDETRLDEVIPSVSLAVDAARERLTEALVGPSRESAIAERFAKMAAHLP